MSWTATTRPPMPAALCFQSRFMDIISLVLFAVTFTSVLILPGPNSAFVVGQTLRYGVTGSLPVPLGFMSATGLHAVLVFSGVGLIFQKYSVALVVLKWFGVLYLLYLAYKAFFSHSKNISVSPKDTSKTKMFLSALLVSLTNPKALLSSLMLYPMFVSPEQDYWLQAVVLSVAAMAVSLTIYIGYALAASTIKSKLASSVFANKLVGSLYLGAASALASKQP